ncbi:MAG: hypothetical protein ABJA82_15840 [Myxococcales bacterium]
MSAVQRAVVFSMALATATAAAHASPDAGVTGPAGSRGDSGPPPPKAGEYPLRASTNGSGELIYEGQGFSAYVARDGSVRFKDKHLTLLTLLPFLPVSGPQNIPSLQATVTGILRHGKVPQRDPRTPNDTSFLVNPPLTPYRPDPREACRQCSVPLDLLPIGLTFRFDLTDEVMRMSGQDPYRYEKARFLVATRELRVRKAAALRAENIRNAASDLRRQLMEIACDGRRSPRERRQIIEELRQELQDDTTDEGRAASAAIRRFVSAQLGPAGDSGGAVNPDAGHEEFCPALPQPAPTR